MSFLPRRVVLWLALAVLSLTLALALAEGFCRLFPVPASFVDARGGANDQPSLRYSTIWP